MAAVTSAQIYKMIDGAYFYEKADHLLRLVKHIRAQRIGTDELCTELESLANEFMRKAVELESKGASGKADLDEAKLG